MALISPILYVCRFAPHQCAIWHFLEERCHTTRPPSITNCTVPAQVKLKKCHCLKQFVSLYKVHTVQAFSRSGVYIHGFAPPYLAGYFTPVSSIEGRSQLRSAAAGLLLVPRTWTVTIIDPRAFAVSSPAAWNSLPFDLRDPGIIFPVLGRNWKPTYLILPLDCLVSLFN